jgi:DnaK suppressor protein
MSATGSSRPDPSELGSEDQATRLDAELERAIQHLASSQAEYDELLADPGVLQEDRDAAALLLEHARRQVESARSAVENFEAGGYGRCVNCGGDIGAERLAALVDVTTCVECAG